VQYEQVTGTLYSGTVNEKLFVSVLLLGTVLNESLSSWHGVFSGDVWRTWPQELKGN
jgi:hypothetical protein